MSIRCVKVFFMCGINGIFDLKKKYDTDYLHGLVSEMNSKIIYRGPDNEGIYEANNLVMGMRRLSIIDLQSGNQPVINENNSVAVVFNGEIYNFRELRTLLKCRHNFYSNSDTEVLVHAYEEYGFNMLDKLDGMYAFSLFDSEKNILFIARDRMGEKPLYYYIDDYFFIWGSELKSLLSTGLIEKEIDREALNQYLQLTYIPSPNTIFKNVKKLRPGHYLTVSQDGKLLDKEYWNLKQINCNNKFSYEEAKKKLFCLVEKSVKEKMLSDVPVGAFLSGGIDSSSIVGLMAGNSEKPIETFTIGYEEKEYDERKRAKLTADLNKTNHHEYIIDFGDVVETIDLILNKLDEPFADTSVIPTYYVSKFAAAHVKVVLTGDAGDELFLGYNKYLVDYYSCMFNKLPKLIKNIIKKVCYFFPDKTSLTRKIRKVLDNLEEDIFEQRKSLMSIGFKENERKVLLKEKYFDKKAMDFIGKIYYDQECASELKRTQYTDLSVVLEGDMLAKVDKMSMLNSLETRVPLLSRDIIEFAYSLPDNFKINGKRLKCIMKDAFADILPKNYDKFAKSGFGIPLDYWFRNQLRPLVESMLNEKKIKSQGIFEWKYIKNILDEHNSGKINHKTKIWTLIVFQWWYEKYFK